jgi:phosphoglycolate phosphatase
VTKLKFKAAIFDLDGTLVDSLSDIADSMNRVLSLHGFPIHPLSDYRQFIGDGMRVLVTRALPEGLSDSKLIDLCLSQMKDEYSRNWNCKTRVYGEIPQLLKYLSDKGLVLSVLSNKPHEFTVKVIEHYFGNSVFKEILGAGKFPKKPDPSSALSIAQSLRISPSDFLYLGDSAVDMKTAKSAGMFACGCLWGFREKEELLDSGADLIAEKPEYVIRFMEKIEKTS